MRALLVAKLDLLELQLLEKILIHGALHIRRTPDNAGHVGQTRFYWDVLLNVDRNETQ